MNWTVEEKNIIKCYGENSDINKLKELLPGRSNRAISTMLARMKVRKSKEYRSAIAYVNGKTGFRQRRLTSDFNFDEAMNKDIVHQIFLGSLFGDGCLEVKGTNRERYFSYSESHGKDQREYLKWKFNILKEFLPSWFEDKQSCKIQTPSHENFKQFHNKIYLNTTRKKILPIEYVANMTLLGVLIWYLDDGTFHHGQPSIESKVFSKENLEEVVGVLNRQFNLSLAVSQYKHPAGTYQSIRFHAKNRDAVFPTWRKMTKMHQIPQCMHYKLGI